MMFGLEIADGWLTEAPNPMPASVPMPKQAINSDFINYVYPSDGFHLPRLQLRARVTNLRLLKLLIENDRVVRSAVRVESVCRDGAGDRPTQARV